MRFVVISDLHLQIPEIDKIKQAYGLYYFERYDGRTDGLQPENIRDCIVAMQRYCLEDLCDNILKLKPNFLFITGDVFDTIYIKNFRQYEKKCHFRHILENNISDYALKRIFRDFLFKLVSFDIQIFIIPGNHDIVDDSFWNYFSFPPDIYIGREFKNNLNRFIYDDYGFIVNFYLLPYIKDNNSDLLDKLHDYFSNALIKDRINILFAHQFVELPIRSDDNLFFKGRPDVINVNLLDGFDFVFLGHYHKLVDIWPYEGRIYAPGQVMLHDNNVNTYLSGGYVVDTFLNHNKLNFNVKYIYFDNWFNTSYN